MLPWIVSMMGLAMKRYRILYSEIPSLARMGAIALVEILPSNPR